MENFKISRPVFVCFLLLCFGLSPILATGSGSNDPELEFNFESELPNLQGCLWTLVTFLVLWFASVGCYGNQPFIVRSYAREGHELARLRGLIFPPVIVTETNPHANFVPPAVMTMGGGPISPATRDMLAEVEIAADPNIVAAVETSADPVETYPL